MREHPVEDVGVMVERLGVRRLVARGVARERHVRRDPHAPRPRPRRPRAGPPVLPRPARAAEVTAQTRQFITKQTIILKGPDNILYIKIIQFKKLLNIM